MALLFFPAMPVKQKRLSTNNAESLRLHGDPKGTRTPVPGVRGLGVPDITPLQHAKTGV